MGSKTNIKPFLFWGLTTAVLFGALMYVSFLTARSSKNILPEIIKAKSFRGGKRTPGVFAENFSSEASNGELIYHGNNSFSFRYTKSGKQAHPFTGVYFPLENIDIDFSEYDAIVVGIKIKKARRIPFNLSVQTLKETHQYVRQFLDVKENQEMYTLQLSDFFTPTSWYDRNDVAKVDIPNPDFSKVEALSFESCHLLKPLIEDEFEVFHLELKKDHTWTYTVISCFVILVILTLRVWLFRLFSNKKEIIHIPIKQIEREDGGSMEDKALAFLAENYTNPNLTLNDLTENFGINNREMSAIIKNKTAMAFPKYISFMRVEEAKRLIKSKDYKTISEVGYAVGFNSPSNFNRVFKAMAGISPKQFE